MKASATLSADSGVADSLDWLRAAHARAPAQPHIWQSYIAALLQAGQPELARSVFDQGQQRGLPPGMAPLLLRELTGTRSDQARAAARRRLPHRQDVDAVLALVNAGQGQQAEPAARSMVLLWPRFDAGWTALGAALALQGRHAEALAPLQKAVALAPPNAAAHDKLGDVLHALGRTVEAGAAWRKAVALVPGLAATHAKLKNLQGVAAPTQAAAVATAAPQPPRPATEEVLALFRAGRYDAVETRARTMTLQFPDFAQGWNMLGAALAAQGRLAEAVSPMEMAVRLAPHDAAGHRNLAGALYQLGRTDEAEARYRTVLQHDAANAEAHNNLGNILRDRGDSAQAEASYRNASRHDPAYAPAHYNLALLLDARGAADEALQAFQRFLALQPDSAEAHSKRGMLLRKQGRLEEAQAALRRALALAPDDAQAHGRLGIVLTDLGSRQEALACQQRALELRPDYVEAHNNLGYVLMALGRPLEAQASYNKALALAPHFVDTHCNLGLALQQMGKLEQAEASYRRALALKPDYAAARNNLGNALQAMGRLDEAEACFREVLRQGGARADALCNLGNLLKVTGRLTEALQSYRDAIAAQPTLAEAHNNLGNALLQEAAELALAEASLREAVRIKPDYFAARSNLLASLNYIPGHTPQECLDEAHAFGGAASGKVTAPYSAWNCVARPQRLRVGFVSGDLRTHPVGYFLEGVLARLDKKRIEAIAFSTHHKSNEGTERLKPHFASWHSLVGQGDEAAARIIHGQGVHVLLDLSGHTAYGRLPLFAWRPAPVQASWLGYFATTGMPQMDYLIADPLTLRPDQEAFFTESIWRLPQTRLCFTAPQIDVAPGPLPAAASGQITFGCFNNLAKMNDAVVALWARVLRAVPGSRLFLKSRQLTNSSVRQRTTGRFAAQGIAPERLLLEGQSPRKEYLEAYHRVDMALDPFPFTGGTTTAEALWMGVPVLTLAGASFVARQGLGLLHNAGLPDWVAQNEDDYVAKAVAHVADLPALATLRAGLRKQVVASPVFDAKAFARHLEEALWGMWDTHQGGMPEAPGRQHQYPLFGNAESCALD
jgi:protein O-GlcNAc transferase